MHTWINSLRSKKHRRTHELKRPVRCKPLGAETLAVESLEQRTLLSADTAAQAANAAAMTAPASTGMTENVFVINNFFGASGTASGGAGTNSNGTSGTGSTSTNGGVQTGANGGLQTGAGGSLSSSGVESPANGNIGNGTGTNGQFGLQTGVNTTANGQVTGTGANTSFGSQNPGDAGMGAPGTSFNPGVGLDTRPGDQNPGDAGFGAPGTSFNPTGIPVSQAGSGGNGTAAANNQATDTAFAHVDTAAFEPAVVQFEMENAATHPVQ